MTQETNRPETAQFVADYKDIVFKDSHTRWHIDESIHIKIFPQTNPSLLIGLDREFPIAWTNKNGLVTKSTFGPTQDVKHASTIFNTEYEESIQIGDFTITYGDRVPQGESFRISGLKPETQIHKESRENNVGHAAK